MRLVKSIFSVNFRTTFPSNFFILLCAVTLLQISGDIELNSGPKKTKVRVRMSRSEMFVFQKIWRTLFSCNIHFEIRPVALFPTNLSFFHLNFNIITAHNFRKISLFEAYINLTHVFLRQIQTQVFQMTMSDLPYQDKICLEQNILPILEESIIKELCEEFKRAFKRVSRYSRCSFDSIPLFKGTPFVRFVFKIKKVLWFHYTDHRA